jgi:hypothetical protein
MHRRSPRNAALPRLAAIAALAALALSPAPARAGFQGSLIAAAGPGYDSNPRRTVGEESAGDAMLTLTASGKGRLTLSEAQSLTGRFEIGAKKFVAVVDEDVLVQAVDLAYGAQMGDWLLGAEGLAKLRLSRGGARDYTDLDAGLFVDCALSRLVSLRLDAGARRFLYPPDSGYDALGPRGVLSARWSPGRRHALSAALSLGLPAYAALARRSQAEVSGVRRKDRVIGAQATYAFRGPLALQASYAFFEVDSNSFGERSARHRISAAATGRLPLGLVGAVQVAWQFIRYPDGIFLSEALLLQDDESQSSVAAKLALPVSSAVDLELRWALNWIALPAREAGSPALSYLRQTGGLGAAVRF